MKKFAKKSLQILSLEPANRKDEDLKDIIGLL
jgi:hypothetical protein